MGHLELTSDNIQYTKRNIMSFYPGTASAPLQLVAKVPNQAKLQDCKTYFSPGKLPLASLIHRKL